MISLSAPCIVGGGGCGGRGGYLIPNNAPQIRVPCVIVAAHVPDCWSLSSTLESRSSRVGASASRHRDLQQSSRWHQSSMLSGETMFGWIHVAEKLFLFNVSGTTQRLVVEVSPRATLIFKQHTCSNQSGTWLPDSHSSSVLQVTAQYCNRTRHCASASRARKWGVVARACALYQ